MDFKQIEAFVNVAKHGSFSKAADATFLTQPTISAHIMTLEKELRLQLIDRSKKQAALTSEGKVFYDYAVSMINTREQAVYSLQNFSLNMNGIIEIQASSVPGEYIVPGLIASFRAEYKQARFYLEQSDSENVFKNIKAHKGEIGFTGSREYNGLTYKRLMKDRAVLITPSNDYFTERLGKPIKIEEFISRPFVVREQGSATRKILEESLQSLGLKASALDITAKMNSMEAIKQAVRGGVGISVISEAAVDRDYEKAGYLVFDLEERGFDREFYLVYNGSITLSPTAETFRRYVLERFGYEVMD